MLTDAEPSPLEAFLRACSVVAPDEESGPLLRQSAALVSCWDALPSDAASHGLPALVLRHACAWNVQLPRSVRRQMDVHLLRQHAQQAAQYEVLREIADAFTLLGIAYVVLKGPVLAHAIYPDPRLRSMSDLDILVRMVDIQRVQGVLQALGFGSPRSLGPVRPHAHHHLPPLQLCRHGETVTVEVHVSAVSRDQGGGLALDASRELRQIQFGQREIPAFGHIDMLTHLTAHLLEPAERTRLRDVAELVGYAAHFADDIDWERLSQRHFRVTNALALMGCLVPLPRRLRERLSSDIGREPAGVGRGVPPLGTLTDAPLGHVVAQLLYPSDWWMHAFYGVPAGSDLTLTRWTRHASRLAWWLGRRTAAGWLL